MKRTATALALLLTVACASTPMTSSSSGAGETRGVVTADVRNAPDYVLLSAPSQLREWDFGLSVGVRGLHLRGTMTNRGFQAAGEIQGNGKFCADGQDWLSLSDLKIYTASSGKTKVAPYIEGCANGSSFQPSSREIVR